MDTAIQPILDAAQPIQEALSRLDIAPPHDHEAIIGLVASALEAFVATKPEGFPETSPTHQPYITAMAGFLDAITQHHDEHPHAVWGALLFAYIRTLFSSANSKLLVACAPVLRDLAPNIIMLPTLATLYQGPASPEVGAIIAQVFAPWNTPARTLASLILDKGSQQGAHALVRHFHTAPFCASHGAEGMDDQAFLLHARCSAIKHPPTTTTPAFMRDLDALLARTVTLADWEQQVRMSLHPTCVIAAILSIAGPSALLAVLTATQGWVGHTIITDAFDGTSKHRALAFVHALPSQQTLRGLLPQEQAAMITLPCYAHLNS